MWINESNRKKHILAGALIAIVFTVLGSIMAGIIKEINDRKKGNAFDWLDVLATILGGLIGQAIQIGLYFLALEIGLTFFGIIVIVVILWGFIWSYIAGGKYGMGKFFQRLKSIFIQ